MSTRRQFFSFLVATSFLALPVSSESARVLDSSTNLAALTYDQSIGPVQHHDSSVQDVIGMVQFDDVELGDGLELAVPEVEEELELAVAEDEDEYELALPDFSDGLELAQAHDFEALSIELEDE